MGTQQPPVCVFGLSVDSLVEILAGCGSASLSASLMLPKTSERDTEARISKHQSQGSAARVMRGAVRLTQKPWHDLGSCCNAEQCAFAPSNCLLSALGSSLSLADAAQLSARWGFGLRWGSQHFCDVQISRDGKRHSGRTPCLLSLHINLDNVFFPLHYGNGIIFVHGNSQTQIALNHLPLLW